MITPRQKACRRIQLDADRWISRAMAVIDSWAWRDLHVRPATQAEWSQRPRTLYDGNPSAPVTLGIESMTLPRGRRDGREINE